MTCIEFVGSCVIVDLVPAQLQLEGRLCLSVRPQRLWS
jgi:hypothetical protein